jgi:hypothetical protein
MKKKLRVMAAVIAAIAPLAAANAWQTTHDDAVALNGTPVHKQTENHAGRDRDSFRPKPDDINEVNRNTSNAVQAPEMDPASAAGALTLLLGGLLVLGGRRAKA